MCEEFRDIEAAKQAEFDRRKFRYEGKELVIGTQIGKGNFSIVYEVREESPTALGYAFKHILAGNKGAEYEFMIVRLLSHPNVVKYYHHEKSGEWNGLLCERMECSLSEEIQALPNSLKMDLRKLILYSIDICCGLAYLHRQMENREPIIHCDLRSPNILIKESKCKIADFGIARTPSTCLSLGVYSFGDAWRAPEITEQRKCTPKADVYSFGTVLWEMFTSKTVCRSQKCPLDVIHRPEKLSRPIRAIITKCWEKEETRYCSQEVLGAFNKLNQLQTEEDEAPKDFFFCSIPTRPEHLNITIGF